MVDFFFQTEAKKKKYILYWRRRRRRIRGCLSKLDTVDCLMSILMLYTWGQMAIVVVSIGAFFWKSYLNDIGARPARCSTHHAYCFVVTYNNNVKQCLLKLIVWFGNKALHLLGSFLGLITTESFLYVLTITDWDLYIQISIIQ